MFSSSLIGQQNVKYVPQEALEVMAILKGGWQFHYGDLLSASQMDAIQKPVYVDVPSTWDQYEAGYSKFGIATYYLKVVVDNPEEPLALNARIAGLNYRLYANDHFIGELGKVGNSPETSLPKYQNIIYKLPSGADTLKLIYHVSNFHYRKGGLWRAPVLGSEEVLIAEKEKKLIIDFFLMGAIVFMGIYHLALNIFRRKNKLALAFALVCFLTAIRSASVGEFVLVQYFDWSWWVVTRIEFISFFLLLSFMSRFIYHLFPKVIDKRISAIPFYFGIVAAVITVFASLYYSSHIIPVAQVLTILTGLYYIWTIAREAIKKNVEAIAAFVGLTILFSASVFEILMHHTKLTGDVVFATGIFLYLFSHVIIIAYRSNKDYIEKETLSNALQTLNSELEQKVQSRTYQLDKRNVELEKANENLQQLNAEKDDILHVVAHDLKSPLNSTIGLSQVIRISGEIKNEEHLKYLDLMEDVNKQGIKFINDLLVLYQFEDAYKPSAESLNLNDFFEKVNQKFQQKAQKKSIAFSVSQAEEIEKSAVFYTDSDMLSRIIDNLLSNALKYSYPETEVSLSYQLTKAANLQVTISDQGQGIPEKEHGKIFKKFQKISTKPTGKETSSGLGLSIVKQLVVILGGEITFKSEVNKGTTFDFIVPEINS
ncbi:MAG: signal transduction histidine kinase [Marivirga sp.]